MASTTKSVQLNPRTTSYEFLGPPGALFITLTVPIFTYALYFGCSQPHGCPPNINTIPDQLLLSLSNPEWWKGLWDTQAALIYLGWYAFCIVAWVVLPGDRVEGTTLRNGGKKLYTINGSRSISPYSIHDITLFPAFSTFLLALGITFGIIYRYGPEAFTFLYERWVGFVTAALLMSIVQGVACYIASFRKGALLALGGNSGNHIYDVCSTVIACKHF